VCQLLTPVARTVQLPPRAWPVAPMAQRLKPAYDLPPEFVAQYYFSDIFPESRCMLLSPLGVVGLGVGEDDERTSVDTEADTLSLASSLSDNAVEAGDPPSQTPRTRGTLPSLSLPVSAHDGGRTTAAAVPASSALVVRDGDGAVSQPAGETSSDTVERALTFCAICLDSLERHNPKGNPPR